ncbi:tyrosine-type recombinase/integrase [Novosphingobium sp. EMRT-2]|uniref:tyrosine-type recombinase/integrase n=1 Tax=Novosphingobium sp. EMRT-2 TaxID=2571749 RepID=UPI00143DD053|nr:tyrosine-type recombinase/integrase [Novosphingobium sp. EMRT-2]
MKLTDSILKRQKPDKGYVDLNDEGTPLVARIKANGEKIFIWRGRVGGKQTKKIIGAFPAMSVVDARATALAMRSEAKHVIASPKFLSQPRFMTLSKAFERYMKEHGDNLSSGEGIRGLMNLRIMPTFGARDIASITRKELNEHFNAMRSEYTGSGINRVLAHLKAFLNWCVREDLIEHNPAHQIQKKAKENIRRRVLIDHELGYVQLAFADMDKYHEPLMLLLHTVTRLSDIFYLKWKEVRKTVDGFELHIEKTKAGVPHIVHLTKQAQKYLPERPANAHDEHFVFPLISRARGSSYLSKMRKLTEKMASDDRRTMAHYTIHDFRTAASTFLSDQKGRGNQYFTERGMDMLLAHVPKSMTNRSYNHSQNLDERKEMLTIWSDHLDACLAMVTK